MSVRGVKRKRQKRKAPVEDKAQSARFIAEAKRLGVDETGAAFERALEVFAPKKPRKPPAK